MTNWISRLRSKWPAQRCAVCAVLCVIGTAEGASALTVSPVSLSKTVVSGNSDTGVVNLTSTYFTQWTASVRDFSTGAPYVNFTGVRVLFDENHGQPGMSTYSMLQSDTQLYGAAWQPMSQPVGPAALIGENVFWSAGATSPWSAAEGNAIKDWVYGGGSLVLELTDPASASIFNDLLSAMGVSLSFGGVSFAVPVVPSVYSHAATEDITALTLPDDWATIVSLGPSSEELFVLAKGDPMVGIGLEPKVVVEPLGAGWVVLVASDMFGDASIGGSDNLPFARQLLHYVSGRHVFSATPGSGTAWTTPQPVTVGYDAQGLSASNYIARMRFTDHVGSTADLLVVLVVSPATAVLPANMQFRLEQNVPNPFNPETTIRFVVSSENTVTITVYGPRGEKVRTLVNRRYAPGEWSTVWDGTDDAGRRVASGVYYYRMRIGASVRSKKMVLLK